jgi:hypothetical protein
MALAGPQEALHPRFASNFSRSMRQVVGARPIAAEWLSDLSKELILRGKDGFNGL